MSDNIFSPGPSTNTVRAADGEALTVPDGWILLPPGDAAMTRRVKAAGNHWVVQEKKGRKVFSRGVWAPALTIDRIRAELEAERSTESYAKRKAADAKRRETIQAEYVEDFFGAVVAFLDFHPDHADLGQRLARAVTDHATPVGSGTVARTKRIPVEQRAEAAVIAWMRHQTTGYEGMVIPRVKGNKGFVLAESGKPSTFGSIECEGTYRHHLQGICTNEKDAIYWSFTTTLVKTDPKGSVLKQVPVANAANRRYPRWLQPQPVPHRGR